jgi:hypothetical protein
MKEIVVALITATASIVGTWITQVAPRNDAITQLQHDVLNLKRPPQTPQTNRGDLPFFQVLSVLHKNGSNGVYFDFDASDLDAILSRKDWNDTKISVCPNANGAFQLARVWRSANGGPGTAHGRYETGSKPNDWRSGDLVYVRLSDK